MPLDPLWASKLLDLHLSRTIKRKSIMDKFTELADGIEQDLRNWDEQADELLARREKNRLRGENVFARHRDKQSSVEAGLAKMEAVLQKMEGGNSKNSEEGSGGTSGASKFSGTEKPVATDTTPKT